MFVPINLLKYSVTLFLSSTPFPVARYISVRLQVEIQTHSSAILFVSSPAYASCQLSYMNRCSSISQNHCHDSYIHLIHLILFSGGAFGNWLSPIAERPSFPCVCEVPIALCKRKCYTVVTCLTANCLSHARCNKCTCFCH